MRRLPAPDSVLVVTGASSGIGHACALLAATRNPHLVLVARETDRLIDVAAQSKAAGAASTLLVAADVGCDADVAALMAKVVDTYGRVDAVLHCAGIVTYGRTEDTDAGQFAQVVETNLLGSATIARHVVPQLRRQRRGDLVLVGSLLGHIAVPEMTPYVVSKWGVRALARQLSIENKDMPRVRITHVAPGSVDTPIYDNALDAAGTINRPPPPTITPQKAAMRILAQLGSRRLEHQTAWSNYALIAVFRSTPRVWDLLVGPAFKLLSRQARR